MTTLQVEAARAALKKMFSEGFFSICVVDQILKITRGVPSKEDYDTLRLLHCVHFTDMSPELRKELPSLIQRVLEAPSIVWQNAMPLSVTNVCLLDEPKTNQLKRR